MSQIESLKEEVQIIERAIAVSVRESDPSGVWEKLEMCVSLLGLSAGVAAKTKRIYDLKRKELLDSGEVKRTDSTGHIEANMPDETYQRYKVEMLERSLRGAIEGLRSLLSSLKTEQNNTKNYN